MDGLKVQIAVSGQLQRALHDPGQGISVLSSKMIGHFLNKQTKYVLFNHKCSSCTSSAMRVCDFTHYVITLEKSLVQGSHKVLEVLEFE